MQTVEILVRRHVMQRLTWVWFSYFKQNVHKAHMGLVVTKGVDVYSVTHA